jgi:hypothetical protein
LFAEIQKLMGSKVIGFDDVSPMNVDRARTLIFGPNPILPVVVIRKAPARPPQIRNLNLTEGGNDIVADAAGIGDGRIFANPEAVINAASQMFRKVPIDMAINASFTGIGMNNQLIHNYFYFVNLDVPI